MEGAALPEHRDWENLRKDQLPSALLQLLKTGFTHCSSKVLEFFPADQGGGKMLLELQDGQRIETVLIEHAGPKPRSTVCVSSQIGCKMGCSFCATGTMGLRGQLSAGEILEQLFHAKRFARSEAPVRNVVFMGMGEPLDNYENVIAAVKVMPEHAFGLALKNVTISTVGVMGRIRALGSEFPFAGPNLALSLHAPTQELRRPLVPSAKGLPLTELMREVDDYGELTGSKVMMEYILIADVNSSESCAHQLGELLANCRALVMLNVIPYNPTVSGEVNGYRPPTDAECRKFKFIVAEYRRRWDAPGNAGADGQAGAPVLCTVRWSTVPGQVR
ncbi:Ribosomal RNA large subunit methyltransferase N (23S rRNA (adenine(2503)-C(2))-methyltransferase) (23S rRNA m2A2503 methyltransferase) [Durusdinium trenchii]|uniref:Ribosomal RNA large subunit methyltransferase N (23S rRNA (Adenine(2503)-C(2))-methyltransferase) (23S rRNA m2A2503 methyltransferase) n=1 Tax=Durusdinium trenchii TaxID=1381693 RepID=A0ABP0IBB7_9DINO